MSERNRPGGPHPVQETGARPLSPRPLGELPATIFCYMKGFVLEKFMGKLTGRNSAATRRNLGGINLGLWGAVLPGTLPSGRGKSSPTILSSGGVQSPSTYSPAPSPLKTVVHLLYPILYQNHKLVHVGC